MPESTLSIPVLGNTWAVGLAFQIHLVAVAFIIGIAVVAPVAELLGLRRGGNYWDRLAHELAHTIVRLFSFGATWAVLALVLLYGLYPRLFGVLTRVFFGPLAVVAGLWFVMTLSAYLYYYTWDRLADQRRLHMAVGWTFAGSTLMFIGLITFLSSYMLTPVDPDRPLPAGLNPSWFSEIVHRDVGNLSYAGLLLAAYAGARLLFFPVGNEDDRAYHDWLGHLGILLGAGLALLQPFAGWFYAYQVREASYGAYYRMMIGENAWMFLVQTFLFGSVLLLGNLYLSLAVERGSPGPGTVSWMRGSLWAIGALALLGIVPKEWPLGAMTPWKYISLAGVVVLSFVNLLLYLRARPDFVWGRVGRGSQVALAALGVAIVALMVMMGTIREGARGGYLIYERLPIEQAQELEQQ